MQEVDKRESLYRKIFPLLFSLFILFIIILVLTLVSYSQNSFHLIYTLDDAYIHMAMAKNFAIHGVWGVTKYGFSTSSSSLLWTSMLAFFYKITGPSQIIPFVLNILSASLILVFVYSVLKKQGASRWFITAVLAGFVILPPLPPLIFTGLEHVLHILISLMFIYYASKLLAFDKRDLKILILVLMLGILLPVLRYEGMVIVISCAFLLFLQKRFVSSLLMIILPLIPVTVFGIHSIFLGWPFFPNSMLLKGGLPDVYSFSDFLKFFSALTGGFISPNAFLFLIIAVVLATVFISIFIWNKKPLWLRSKNFNILFLFAANIVLYSVYARSDWSYRYQSFLISLCLFVFALIYSKQISEAGSWKNFPKQFKVTVLVIIPVLLLLTYNCVKLIYQIPLASKNIYEQQYQMGRFLNLFYNDKSVALNDVGTCNYLADIHCLDLWGLSNLEMSQFRRSGHFDENDIRWAAEKYKINIAIVYDAWFIEKTGSVIPREWIKVGQWTIKDNIIAGDSTVSFYAVNVTEENILRNNLKIFSDTLPPDVIQSGKYMYLIQ